MLRPLQRVFARERGGWRCPWRVSELSLAVIAARSDYPFSLPVDIAQLKPTSVVTRERDRLRPRESAHQGRGPDQSRTETRDQFQATAFLSFSTVPSPEPLHE